MIQSSQPLPGDTFFMNRNEPLAADALAVRDDAALLSVNPSAAASAVSWGAVLAGAAGAAALSLILLILGTGLGLSSVSPWANQGIEAKTFGVSSIIWVIFTQLAASGLGGYLAGRLRTRWLHTQADEVYFRDTAHGFLAWAVASLATAALLTSVIAGIVGSGLQTGATAAAGAAAPVVSAAVKAAEPQSDGTAYFVDGLFRRDAAASSTLATPMSGEAVPTAEVTRIFANGLRDGSLAADDLRYVAGLVAQRTGLSQTDAEKRVNDSFARWQTRMKDAETAAREAADKARKAASRTALWLFVSLLIGAFVASLAATFGGRQRDL
jgi:hypothetical protein